jgi:hypothetical protein
VLPECELETLSWRFSYMGFCACAFKVTWLNHNWLIYIMLLNFSNVQVQKTVYITLRIEMVIASSSVQFKHQLYMKNVSKEKWQYYYNRPWRPVGMCDVEDSTLSKQMGLVWPEGLGKLITFNYLIRSRTCYRPACSIVPQPLCYHVPTEEC